METIKEVKKMKDVLRFRLEFMLMLHSVGRSEEADKMLGKLFSLIEKVEGDYNEE
jgi:hypothetical protein